MSVRNDVVDKARENVEEYLIKNNITNHEWEWIERYIDERFDLEKHKLTLKR